MNVEFTNRAVRDLRDISDYSRRHFGNRVAAALEGRLRDAVTQIARAPESAPCVEQDAGLRVLSIARYPFRVFYRVIGDTVRIVHIRHTSRQPW